MLMVAASAVLIICLLLFWYTVQVFLLVFAGVLLAIFLRGLSERDGHSRAIARGETVSSASVARRRGTGEGAKAVWGKLRGGSASGRADTPGAPSPEG
jgi:membrane protein implicated in regulation of membrane protease activity